MPSLPGKAARRKALSEIGQITQARSQEAALPLGRTSTCAYTLPAVKALRSARLQMLRAALALGHHGSEDFLLVFDRKNLDLQQAFDRGLIHLQKRKQGTPWRLGG